MINKIKLCLVKIPLPILVALLALPLFLISADSWYHSDDFTSLLPFTTSWSNIFSRLFTKDVFVTCETTFYRPLALLIRALTTKLDSAYFGHVVNILLHYGSAFYFWRLLLLWKIKPRYASAGAILFLLNPAISDALFWISGLGDLMTTFFSLMVLYLIFKHHERNYFDLKNILTISAVYIAALLSKETSFILPILLLVIFGFKKELAKTYKIISLLLLISVTVFIIRGIVLGHFLMGEADSVYFSLHYRYPINFIKYLISSIIPARIHFLYFNKLYFLSCLPAVVIWFVYLLKYKNRAWREVAFILLLLMIAVLPVLGIFSVWRNYFHSGLIIFTIIVAADRLNKPYCRHLLNSYAVIFSLFLFYAGYSYYLCGNFNKKIVQAVAKIPQEEVLLLNIPATFLDTPLIYENLAFEDAVNYFHGQKKKISIGLLRHSTENLPSHFSFSKADTTTLDFQLSTPLSYEYYICNRLQNVIVNFTDQNMLKPKSATIMLQSKVNAYVFR